MWKNGVAELDSTWKVTFTLSSLGIGEIFKFDQDNSIILWRTGVVKIDDTWKAIFNSENNTKTNIQILKIAPINSIDEKGIIVWAKGKVKIDMKTWEIKWWSFIEVFTK